MSAFIKGIAYLLFALLIFILGVFVYADFADGPLEMVAGGPFRSGCNPFQLN